jgi:tetratricopeptide (TPR) repeat protein
MRSGLSIRPRALALAVAVAVALAAGGAPAAQPRKLSAAERAQKETQARNLYKRAMTHYEIGEFDNAIDEFKRAYALTSAPGLLFNIAQVHRMKKDPTQALFFYRMFLRLQPTAPNRSDVEALIVESQAQLDQQQQALLEERERAKAPPRLEPSSPSLPAAAPPASEPSPTPASPPSVASAPSPLPPRPSRWRLKVWSGVGTAALGLGALATGLYLGLRASSDADDIARASQTGGNTWDAARQSQYREGQSFALASNILYVGGGVMVATGALLSYLGWRERAQSLKVAVAPVGRGAAVVMSCAF